MSFDNSGADMEILNQKIDVLFDQLAALQEREQIEKAARALVLWKSAKTCEFLGLGPMEARHEYRTAYRELAALGLDVSGMIPPYEGQT